MKKILTLMALLVAFVTTGFADTWTVAGSAAALNGNADWAEANVENDMTSTDGVNFTLTVTDCTLEQGTNYEFKVVKNHAWDEAYPGSNYTFGVSETAVYTVVYTFNSSSHEVGVTTTKTGEAGEITHTYTVAGSPEALFGAEWAPDYTDNDMILSEGLYTWTKNDVELDADLSISFKVCVDHGWGTAYPSSNFDVTSTHGYVGAGTYNVTITFNEETKAINATFEKQVENAEITSVHMHQDGKPSYEITANTPNVYTTTVGLWATLEDYVFELIVNPNPDDSNDPNTKLVHFSDIAIDPATPEGWLVEGSNGMIVLKNSISGYGIYNLTATWTPGPDASKGWTLKVEGVTPRPNADINSVKVVVPGAPIDPFDITNKKEEVDGKYVYSMDMDLSVVTDNIPFYFVVNGTQIPLDNITVEGLLVESPNTPLIGDCIMLMQDNHAVYTATATWTPNPNALANWTMKVVGKEPRPEGTTYSIIYNTTNQDDDWKVGDTMTETTEGVFTATFSNKPGMLFAIAPTGSIGITGIQWNQIIRPVTEGNNWEIDFADYEGTTELNANGKVWAIDAANNADVTISFTPGEPAGSFTITNELEFTIGQYGYSTYSNARKYKVVDATANFVTVSGSEATLVAQAADAILPAMTGAGKSSGIIISGTAGAKAIIKSANQSADAVDSSANLLAGSGDNTYEIGTQFADGDEYTAYIFTKPEGKDLGFYLLDPSQGATLAAHKAFLAVPKTGGAPQFIGFGGTTGIDSVERGALNVEGCYTLDGRRVENPTKGLYIINGKKVVIK